MRPIIIDNRLLTFVKSFSSKLHENKSRKEAINNLLNSNNPYGELENRIVKLIVHNFNNQKLLYCTPRRQQFLVDLTDKYLKNVFFCEKRNKQLPFGIKIEKALKYNLLQKTQASEISRFLGIKTCPYCNATLTVTMNKRSKEVARFQLDHFFPKSKYPFLSISFFNLIPSCCHCNQRKGQTNFRLGELFNLYSTETPKDAFSFRIDRKGLIQYFLTLDNRNISFHIKPTNPNHSNYMKKHLETFNIEYLYNTQLDVIEELIWKSQYYSKSRIEEISNLLNGLHNENVTRMLLGNFGEYEDIHKRPLAKFTQDIARDLKLIK